MRLPTMVTHHLSLAVEPEREAVRIAITRDEATVFAARLEAPELDQLIHALAQGRAQLTEEVSPELDEGARLTDVEADPSFLIAKNNARGEAMMAFRHPGFGWLGFRLRRRAIEKMVERLERWLHAAA